MPEDKHALLTHYHQMRATLLAAIDGLSDAQLTETSLDGWSIKDHLAHVALWDEIRAAEVARITAGHESVWRGTPEQGDDYNKLAYDLRRNMSLAQARWESDDTHRRFIEALAAANERGLDGSLYGEAGLKSDHEAAHAGWIKDWRAAKGI